MDIFLRYDHAPASVEQLVTEHELASERPIELEIWKCTECDFIQLRESPLPSGYYRIYDKSTSHSRQAQTHQVELAAELGARFNLRGKRILEAGCGDGFFAAALRDLGATVQAVEPGRPSAEATRARGVPVTEAFLGTDNPIEPESIDVFVARQVISHVLDLDGFMAAVALFLKPDGLAIIEAPNVNTAIEKRRFFDFFADYANYFAPGTLTELFRRYGCGLEEITARSASEHFLAVYRKSAVSDFMESFEGLVHDVRQLVASEQQQGHRIACWGAGGRGIAFISLAGLGPGDIEFVIDSSPEKQGLYTPGSHLPVVAPDVLKDQSVDCLIVTALAYKDEILELLEHRYHYSGRVVLLTPEPRIVGTMGQF